MAKLHINLLDFFKNIFYDLFFPKRCVYCGQPGLHLCSRCFQKIEILHTPICPICGKLSQFNKICFNCKKKLSPKLSGIVIAANYDIGSIKEIIHSLKYAGITELASILAELMLSAIKPTKLITGKNKWIIVPVPLHRKKEAKRGFNQSKLLAQYLSKKLKLHLSEALCRIRNTDSQITLPKDKRAANVENAFGCSDRDIICDKNIILIDDVFTTGATLFECAKVLRDNGAKKVWGLVAAKRM